MASITNQRNGRRTIQFIAKDGRRRSIRLGKVAHRQAEAVMLKVEDLVAASITGQSPRPDTSHWVAALDEVMHDKLASVGLVPRRERAALASFIDAYIAERTDVKPATRITYGNARRNLIDCFGAARPMREVTPGEADSFRLALTRELADNTVRKRCGIASQFFEAARRRGVILSNPFEDVPTAVRANEQRQFFVTGDMAEAVLAACPDNEWRLLFALCRYGGLRCPSEVLGLRWGDIDWERDRMRVHSPKTEHHEGKAIRLCPIFPELLPHLREAFDLAKAGAEHVIERWRCSTVNLRTHMMRIICRAGLEPWPKLFQNLRSSRQTELDGRLPSHVVCAFLGNTLAVARKHYLQVTEEHFALAVQPFGAVQKAVQQVQAGSGDDVQARSTSRSERANSPANLVSSPLAASACAMPEMREWAILGSNQ